MRKIAARTRHGVARALATVSSGVRSSWSACTGVVIFE
jgi:hypothetical protein